MSSHLAWAPHTRHQGAWIQSPTNIYDAPLCTELSVFKPVTRERVKKGTCSPTRVHEAMLCHMFV